MENNCFAFLSAIECKILKNTRSCGNNCAFRKTQSEVDESTKRSNARLRSLRLYEQTSIGGKYYAGKMPWINGGDAL